MKLYKKHDLIEKVIKNLFKIETDKKDLKATRKLWLSKSIYFLLTNLISYNEFNGYHLLCGTDKLNKVIFLKFYHIN